MCTTTTTSLAHLPDSESDPPIHQPIHPSVLHRLDLEYVPFHNKYIAPVAPPHTPHGIPTSENYLSSQVAHPSSKLACIRVYTPGGKAPAEGWPVFQYIHGGGWALGSLDTQASFAAHQCKENCCLTVCLDYRLAPENPYPAAVIDSVDVLAWIYQNGKSKLNANVNKIAVGGTSSGGNLAAIVSLKAQQLDPPVPIVFQLLIVPVIDNTASDSGDVYPSWKEMKDTVWLDAGRMMWFRHNCLPDSTTWSNWDNFPIFAPEVLLANAPPAWVGVCEMDILRDEGIAYGEKLRSLGVKVEIKTYKGVPHQTLRMDRALTVARTMVADATAALGDAFIAA